MKSVFLVLNLILFSLSAFANEEKSIPAFKPGKYKLVSGDAEDCGEGDFSYVNEGQNISLGTFHGFSVNAMDEELPGDAPDESDCKYAVKNVVSSSATEATFSFKSIRKCANIQTYELTKTATIKPKSIKLLASQTGDDAFKYECVWQRK